MAADGTESASVGNIKAVVDGIKDWGKSPVLYDGDGAHTVTLSDDPKGYAAIFVVVKVSSYNLGTVFPAKKLSSMNISAAGSYVELSLTGKRLSVDSGKILYVLGVR